MATEFYLYLLLAGMVWVVVCLALVVAGLVIYERITGNKQIINNFLKEKQDRDLAERGLKRELNKLIDENKKFQSKYEPSIQSKKLDKFFQQYNTINN